MQVDILVLNYNGRGLLAECLPSVLAAAGASRHECRVAVIDNDSQDGSVVWLREHFPEVRIFCCPNRGLCSLNDVLARLESPVAILLNNDVRLAQEAIDPWIAPLLEEGGAARSGCWMTAPRCYGWDGQYEGGKTAVRWRWGLVQASGLIDGLETAAGRASETASAGSALAVDRDVFCRLGGFDPLYLPGRLEDLDLAFRPYLAGYHARYVPEAVVWHLGMGTFGPVFGQKRCRHLDLRNTLLFQWKNLRGRGAIVRQISGLAARLGADSLRAPFCQAENRWEFARALVAALGRLPLLRRSCRSEYGDGPLEALWRSGPSAQSRGLSWRQFRRCREQEFFRRFAPEAIAQAGGPSPSAFRREGQAQDDPGRCGVYPGGAGWAGKRHPREEKKRTEESPDAVSEAILLTGR